MALITFIDIKRDFTEVKILKTSKKVLTYLNKSVII